MNSLNALECRIQRLEDLIGIFDEDPPLLFIRVANNEKNSTDPGTVRLGIIPGRSCGYQGRTLMRNPGENEDDFLTRCESEYDELYG